MPRSKLTEREVRRLKASEGKPTIFWDDGPRAVRGFGVFCSGKSDAKTYVVQRDLPGSGGRRGKTRRVTIAGTNEIDLEEARRRAAKLVVGMREGVDPKAKKLATTLREAMDAYEKARTDLRDRTKEHYAAVKRHLRDWLDTPLRDITFDMVVERHAKLAVEIERRHRERAVDAARRHRERAGRAERAGYPEAAAEHRARAARAEARDPPSGGPTANSAMKTFRLFYNFARVRDRTLPEHPVSLQKMWFHVPRRERHVRGDELPKFYAAVQGLKNPVARDYISFLLFTGMRRREAAGLRWAHVDFADRIIRVPAVNMKAGRRLDLPMCDVVFDMLVARRRLGDGDFVFMSNSESGHIEEPKFFFDQIAEASGVRVSAHDLRRTYITVASGTDNISSRALKALVSHALGSDITAGYDQMSVADLRDPAQRVCDRLKVLCGVGAVSDPKVAALRR